MIKLVLNNTTVLKFNLKNKEREKSLRDAWYAMSDMEKYRKKRLKMITDRGRHYLYAIYEIVDCTYSPEEFKYDEPEIEGSSQKMFENSAKDKKIDY